MPNADVGIAIGRTVVGDGLVACVNVVPGLRSIYRWEGETCEDGEALLIMKTTGSRLEAMSVRIRELHPYEVPEVIALPVCGGWSPYLDWVRRETEG